MALLVGASALAVLIAGKVWLKHRPVAFLVVIGGIAAARLFDLDARGVALLGAIPEGLPSLTWPYASRHDLNELLPVAMAAFVLAAIETTAIGRMFGQKHDNRVDANQELLALGVSNVLSGLGRGLPVSGGMSQSLVNESAGARTPLSGLIAALFVLIIVMFASGLLRNLPQPVLAAVVLAAVMSLVDPVHLFVLFLGTVPKIDLAGAKLLRELHATLRADAITFRLAEAHGEVRDALRRLGFEHEYGPLESGQDVDHIVTRWQSSGLGNQIAGSPITDERLVADGAPAD